MIKTIVVPTDGSASAEKSVEVAADLAEKYGAKMILLHILLRGQMPEGLLRAAQVEHVASGAGTPDNLVNMPQEIMARVQGKKGTQVPLDVLKFLAERILSAGNADSDNAPLGQAALGEN